MRMVENDIRELGRSQIIQGFIDQGNEQILCQLDKAIGVLHRLQGFDFFKVRANIENKL